MKDAKTNKQIDFMEFMEHLIKSHPDTNDQDGTPMVLRAVDGLRGGRMLLKPKSVDSQFIHDDVYDVAGFCVLSGKTYVVKDVRWESIVNYRENNVLAQDAFPSISSDDREFLISGISPSSWRELHESQ